MTLGDLKGLVSFWVDDLNMTYFTPAQLTVFLNRAQSEVQKKLIASGQYWHMKVDTSTSTVINQQAYTVPTDFLVMEKLECVINPGVNEASQSLYSITVNQSGKWPTVGQPNAFYIQKNSIILVPIPNVVQTLRMTYTYKIPDMVVDADVPDIPDQYQEMIALYATYDCFLKDQRDPSPLIRKLETYEETLRSDSQRRVKDHPRTINMLDSGAGTGWY